ncbi:uncharacterized protein PHALS_11497 [Plasmopara halstedii]|uniref:Uncharacterized protein n=1 Tax=Plasmopara halstedii TaxID=4781 RepID=A0A0P1A520_PLAHL|nr:uncharacterized protein PHALS_11497 [Plasmopara halstedii]CEG35626.1 hypothetical protein PHALS_11497 [Plasmopara halstedii]|eukprot:XP_024571995.1 hypothetical protein PHALS_11497 [Plasmopara halstedii]
MGCRGAKPIYKLFGMSVVKLLYHLYSISLDRDNAGFSSQVFIKAIQLITAKLISGFVKSLLPLLPPRAR